MADLNFDQDRSVAGRRGKMELEVSSFAPLRNRAKSPRVSSRVLGTMEEGDMYAGSAGVTGKDAKSDLAEPGTAPEEYGKEAAEGLKHKVSAGSAGMGKELTNRETSLAVMDLEYEEREFVTTGSAREILDKTTNADGDRGPPSKTKIAGNAGEVSDKAMIADSASGAPSKHKSTLDHDIDGFTLMDRDEGSAFVDRRKTGLLAIGDRNVMKNAGSASVEHGKQDILRTIDSDIRMTTGSASGAQENGTQRQWNMKKEQRASRRLILVAVMVPGVYQ